MIEITRDGRVFENGVEKNYWNHSRGYKKVWIDGRQQYVHRLVAETYIPNPMNLPQVNHKDLNTSNNNVDNLEWCTQSYNTRHAISKGRADKLILMSRKLTYQQAQEIRQKYVPHLYSFRKLAKEYTANIRTIYEIVKEISYTREVEYAM